MSMDKSRVKAIVEANIVSMKQALGLGAWHVEVIYTHCDGGTFTPAEIEREVNYQRALITINPMNCDDDQDVLRHLRHELFHIFGAPFDLFYEAAMKAIPDPAALSLQRISQWAHEHLVLSLERMFDWSCGKVSCWPNAEAMPGTTFDTAPTVGELAAQQGGEA